MATRSSFLGGLMLLLVLIFASQETTMARTCTSQSTNFKGLCFSSHNCKAVCNGENFPDGKCHGFKRRCFCQKPC
ncbi:hypothetical protein ACP275_13G122300 [Erythranthe tilingii]